MSRTTKKRSTARTSSTKHRSRTTTSCQARTFDRFVSEVRALLEPTASGKGYSATGVDGPNRLYEFVRSFGTQHHALGEIVYKAVRYNAKGNPEELLKIAAWAWLAWKHHEGRV